MISIAKCFFVKVTIQAILPNCLCFVPKRKTNHPGVSGPGSKKTYPKEEYLLRVGWTCSMRGLYRICPKIPFIASVYICICKCKNVGSPRWNKVAGLSDDPCMGLPSIMGQSLVDLDFLRSRMHILNMRIKTKKSLHISTSQSFFLSPPKTHWKKTHQNLPHASAKTAGPSFTGDLPLAAPRHHLLSVMHLGKPIKAQNLGGSGWFSRFYSRSLNWENMGSLVSPPAKANPEDKMVFSKFFLASKLFEVCLFVASFFFFFWGGGPIDLFFSASSGGFRHQHYQGDAFWERIRIDISPQLFWVERGWRG